MFGLRNFFRLTGAAAAVLTLALMPFSAHAADEKKADCSDEQYRQLDFWIGSWDVTWIGQDQTVGNGTNEIKASLGGCVIEERFSGADAMPLRGLSVSIYHRQKEEWRQLWLDNTGGYLAFTGGPKGKDFVLSLNNPEEAGLYRRMVWTNIKPNSLDWHWQESKDAGKTWGSPSFAPMDASSEPAAVW